MALLFGIVRFRDVDRDQTEGVACDDLRRLGRAAAGPGEKFECKPILRLLRSVDQRQLQPQQPVNQPTFGGLEPLPAPAVFGMPRFGIVRLSRRASQKAFELVIGTSQLQA